MIQNIRSPSGESYTLTPAFKKSLRRALTGDVGNHSLGDVVDLAPNEHLSLKEIDQFSGNQWENILAYIVGSTDVVRTIERASIPAPCIVDLLKVGELVSESGKGTNAAQPKITKKGFSFVLQPITTQLWTIVFLHFSCANELGLDEIEVLSFIFHVLSLQHGLPYSTSTLTNSQGKVLFILAALGIVYWPDDPDNMAASFFYPTRLATILAFGDGSAVSPMDSRVASVSSTGPGQAAQGFIIVETNFRVYAYTSSPLQIALLSLFVNLRSRHPNLVTGKITQNSIQRAVQQGIDAEQIISYLSSHAHPQMRSKSIPDPTDRSKHASVLHATIIDQIHLWQLERERIRTTNGFLVKDFKSSDEYQTSKRKAMGFVLWEDDKKRMFFVNVATADQLGSILK